MDKGMYLILNTISAYVLSSNDQKW